MIKQNYEIKILVNNKPVQKYFHNNKVYIEGRKDTTFAIKLKNNSSNTVLFVPTVDGLSVIDGENASFGSRGYIVKGHTALIIEGWRVSDSEIAEFYFSSVKDSYRKRKGDGINLGSIAVAVFKEKERNYQLSLQFPTLNVFDPWHITVPFWTGSGSTAMYNTSHANTDVTLCAASVQDIGTGFGKTKTSAVTTVEFNREEMPDSILEILYNTREQLNKAGITLSKSQVVVSQQNSFPNENGYCKRPIN